MLGLAEAEERDHEDETDAKRHTCHVQPPAGPSTPAKYCCSRASQVLQSEIFGSSKPSKALEAHISHRFHAFPAISSESEHRDAEGDQCNFPSKEDQ